MGIAGNMQRQNAALAIQLCKEWTDRRGKDQSNRSLPQVSENQGVQTLPPAVIEGLSTCQQGLSLMFTGYI